MVTTIERVPDLDTVPEWFREAFEDGTVFAVAVATVTELEAYLEDREREIAEHEASFDLRWKASLRAIKRWQAATGKELTWPDHTDLCVWLLDAAIGDKS